MIDSSSQDIVIEGPEPLIIHPIVKVKPKDLTRDEATLITEEIRRTSNRLWLLVVEAHDRKAHLALGYTTWDDYARAELQMSPSRSYQLLDTGHVMREIVAAGVDVNNVPAPTTRVVAKVKDRLPEVRKVAKDAVAKGESVDKAIRQMARQPRRWGRAGAEAAAAGGGAAEAPKVATVTCPACDGGGKVTRSMAPKLRAFLKRERSQTTS